MKVLIIGARGFIGSVLSEKLFLEGADVTCVTRSSLSSANNSKFLWLRVDYCSQNSWDSIISKNFDVIYHLGWSTIPKTAEEDPVADVTENVITGIRILNSIKNTSPKSRLIFTSSGGAIYGIVDRTPVPELTRTQPISVYGLGKSTLENYVSLYCKRYHIIACNARLSNPYGPIPSSHNDFGVINTLINACLLNNSIKIYGSLDIVRDYIHITDAISGLIALAKVENIPQEINIGSGTGNSLRELISVIEDITGKKIGIEILEPRLFDVPKIVLDISLIKNLTSWRPIIDINSGVLNTILNQKN